MRSIRPSIIRSVRPSIRRRIHTVPQLANQALYEQEGINGLYSTKGFQDSWTTYQNFLLGKLTNLTVESENESRGPFQILQNTALKSDQAHVFNYASQAYNNHFYFQSLVPSESNNTKPSAQLLAKIEENFERFDTFKSTFLQMADTLKGPGWTFLIEESDKNLYIVNMMNAGTPFNVARSQDIDLNGPIYDNDMERLSEIEFEARNKSKNFTVPLLAVNVWESAYLTDYLYNKADFLGNWWKCINWNVVNKRYFPGN